MMTEANTMLISNRHEWPFIIAAAIFPVIFILLWMITNNELSTADASNYLYVANENYHRLVDKGFWHGLTHFDLVRGWRPIFFPVLMLPFLLISNGNFDFAVPAVACSCIIASAIYIYLISRLVFDRLSSVIAANLICLLSFVQGPVLILFAESALFPAVFGAVYHLIQSDYFRHKKHTIGFVICFSLAIAVRPVEAVTELIFILLTFLFMGWYRQIFSLKQIVLVSALSLSVIFLFLFNISQYFLHHYPLHPIDGGKYDIKLLNSIYVLSKVCAIGMGFAWLGFIFLKSDVDRQKPPLIPVFMAIIVLVSLWFLPHAFELYVWVYRTSIGDLADLSGCFKITESLWRTVIHFTNLEGILVVVGVAITAIAGAIFANKKQLRDISLSLPVIYLLLLIPFPAWEVLNTIQSAERKLNIAFPAFILVLLFLALQQGRYWKLRVSVIGGLLIAQFILVLTLIQPSMPTVKEYAYLMGSYPLPVTFKPDPHEEILKFLNQHASANKIETVIVEISTGIRLPIDPFLLLTMGGIRGVNYKFNIPHIMNEYSDEEIKKMMQPGYAFLISDKSSDMVVSDAAAKIYKEKFENQTDPTEKTMTRLLYLYSANKLHEIGLKTGPCTEVKARNNDIYQNCLLLKSKNYAI